MAGRGDQGLGRKAKRAFRQIGPGRLLGTLLCLLAGLFVARFGWDIPLVSDAERALYDYRFVEAADRRIDQDDRIVLVTFDDQTLEQLQKRSPLDRQMLAQALRAIDSMAPRAIGIDILIDQAQPEDPELIETLRAMKTPVFLAFASSDPEYGNPEQMEYWQEQFLRQFLIRIGSDKVKPASIRIEPDLADGVIRRWTRQDPRLPPLFASALHPQGTNFRTLEGSIDFTLAASDEVGRFANLPVQLLSALEDESLDSATREALASGFAETINDRYVLIGGNIRDLDDFETPMSRLDGRLMKGLEVHAQMLAQQLDQRVRAPTPGWALWIAALAMVVAGALTSLAELRRWKLGLALAVQAGLLAFLPFLLQEKGFDTLGVPAFGWGLGWLLAFAGVGTAARSVDAEQKAFAQSALGKYLPRDIAAEILRDPEKLALSGEKTKIFALFTDLEGFTKLSHAIPPERLSALLNAYLDMMSDLVLQHGGTIDKFVGDAVVAFWGAPIPRDEDSDQALRAAMAMYRACEDFRRSQAADLPPIGCTRVGLHQGEAVVGNFGGKGRIQYTALGDAMNTAARLESANKALKTTILVSDEAKRDMDFDRFRPMGRIVLSGRSTPIIVWEPVPEMDPDLASRLTDLWHAFDGGDVSALQAIEALAAEHKEDAALAFFGYRIAKAGPGGQFVLGSK